MSELTKALIQARIACGAVVRKDGQNTAQGFNYVGHVHVLVSGAREALLLNGLSLAEKSVEFAGELSIPKRDGAQLIWRWRGVFELAHIGGESREYTFEATTFAADKAAYIASTALDRTAMLRVCQLAGGAKEDPEHDSNERYEDAAERPARIAKTAAEKMDKIAAGGTKPAGGPTAQPASTRPVSGDSPAQLPAVAMTVSDETTGEPDAAAWRARYEAECTAALAAGYPFVGEDERGMPIPGGEMPAIDKRAKQHAGKLYDKTPPGYLREVVIPHASFAARPTGVRLHALYLVAAHEQDKAEKSEAADGAAG